MSNINLGSQAITFTYQQQATSPLFNMVNKDLTKAGIYAGGLATILSSHVVQISPFVSHIRSNDISGLQAVRCQTQSAVTVNIPNGPNISYTVYLTYVFVPSATNYADFNIRLTSASPATNEVRICSVTNDGSGNLTSISYANRMRGTIDVDNGDRIATELNPTQGYHVGNQDWNDIRYVKKTGSNTYDIEVLDTTAGNQNSKIEATLTAPRTFILPDQSTTLAGEYVFPLGIKTGGIVYNSVSLPPYVLPGTYDVAGKPTIFTVQTALSLSTNAFLESNPALDASMWYYSVLKRDTNQTAIPYYVLAYGAAIGGHTGNITSITISGGTGTLTAASGTISGDAGKIIVVKNTGQTDGVYLIATNGGAGVCTFKTASVTNTGAVGTYTIYSPVSLLSSPAPTFNPTLNGYYLDAFGQTGVSSDVYVILGIFSTNASPNVVDVISYDTGTRKNDDFYLTKTFTSRATNALRFATDVYTRGTNIVKTDDGTNGTRYTFQASGTISVSAVLFGDGSNVAVFVSKNGTASSSQGDDSNIGMCFVNAGNYSGLAAPDVPVSKGDYIHLGAGANLDTGAGTCRVLVSFRGMGAV